MLVDHEDIESAAYRLPTTSRRQLVEALLESLEDDAEEIIGEEVLRVWLETMHARMENAANTELSEEQMADGIAVYDEALDED